MKMINLKKKGFTIVELVIVIAVIVVLAAVLIPTFSSIVKKSKIAADVQTVRNLNTIVVTEGTAIGGIKTAHDAIVAASNNGYDVTHISPTADGRTIAWDGTNYRFILLDNGELVFPKDNKALAPSENIFVVSDKYPAEGYEDYAVYLKKGYTGTELEVKTGLDVGYNENIIKVTYNGTEEVIIRTNSKLCDFIMNSGVVHHYGVGLKAYINTDKLNYHCYAEMMDSKLYDGETEPTTLFAGGDGTKENPYLVTSSEQFLKIEELYSKMENEGEPQYIKLLSDVETNRAINTMFCGELDGNGHTITFNPETWSWPGLFQGTMNSGETVFKNFTYICENEVAPIAYSAGYNYTGTGVVFENITAKTANPGEVLPLVYNQVSPFLCNTYQGNVTFRNCVNEINFSTTGNYNGIFIGNYAAANWHQNEDGSYAWPTIVFENCVNKGTVSGVNVGFFTGNDTETAGPAKFVNDPNHVNKYSDGRSIAYYISGCYNEGTIIGTKSALPFALYANDENQPTSKSYIQLNNSITNNQFSQGFMGTATVKDISLSIDNNIVTINPSSNSQVDKYVIKLVMYGTKVETDAPQFIIEYEIDASTVSSASYRLITGMRMFDEYEVSTGKTYSQLVSEYGEKETVQFKYVEVPNDDGSITLVIKPTSGSTSKDYTYKNSSPDYNLYAISNGAIVGSVNYRHGEIK